MIHCIKSAMALGVSPCADRSDPWLVCGAAPAAARALFVGSLLAAAPAGAQFVNPLSTNVCIEVTAAT